MQDKTRLLSKTYSSGKSKYFISLLMVFFCIIFNVALNSSNFKAGPKNSWILPILFACMNKLLQLLYSSFMIKNRKKNNNNNHKDHNNNNNQPL